MNLRVDGTDVVNVLMNATRSTEQSPPSQMRAFLRSAGVDLSEVFHAKGHTNVSSARGKIILLLLDLLFLSSL